MNTRKKPIDSFDFIRAVACLGIVLYHFSVEYGWPEIFHMFGGGVSYGDLYVTVFFFISGALLTYHHKEVTNWKQFYKKRFLSIFPAFYLAWGLMYLRDVLRYKNLFYRGNPFSILLSLVGMDGYLAFKVNDYYILGEWFIGAMILLYLLYPFLAWLNNKYKPAAFGLVLLVYLLSLFFSFSGMPDFRTLPSCLLSFYFGMLFVEHRDQVQKWWWIFCIALLLLKCISFGNVNLKGHLGGLCMACTLYGLGTYLMRCSVIKIIMQKISRLSYPVFLTHHLSICLLVKLAPKNESLLIHLLLLFSAILLSFLSAFVLSWLLQRLQIFYKRRTPVN